MIKLFDDWNYDVFVIWLIDIYVVYFFYFIYCISIYFIELCCLWHGEYCNSPIYYLNMATLNSSVAHALVSVISSNYCIATPSNGKLSWAPSRSWTTWRWRDSDGGPLNLINWEIIFHGTILLNPSQLSRFQLLYDNSSYVIMIQTVMPTAHYSEVAL